MPGDGFDEPRRIGQSFCFGQRGRRRGGIEATRTHPRRRAGNRLRQSPFALFLLTASLFALAPHARNRGKDGGHHSGELCEETQPSRKQGWCIRLYLRLSDSAQTVRTQRRRLTDRHPLVTLRLGCGSLLSRGLLLRRLFLGRLFLRRLFLRRLFLRRLLLRRLLCRGLLRRRRFCRRRFCRRRRLRRGGWRRRRLFGRSRASGRHGQRGQTACSQDRPC